LHEIVGRKVIIVTEEIIIIIVVITVIGIRNVIIVEEGDIFQETVEHFRKK